MSEHQVNYNEQVDQSINAIDEFTGHRIEEVEIVDETPKTRSFGSKGWSLYKSIYGNSYE